MGVPRPGPWLSGRLCGPPAAPGGPRASRNSGRTVRNSVRPSTELHAPALDHVVLDTATVTAGLMRGSGTRRAGRRRRARRRRGVADPGEDYCLARQPAMVLVSQHRICHPAGLYPACLAGSCHEAGVHHRHSRRPSRGHLTYLRDLQSLSRALGNAAPAERRGVDRQRNASSHTARRTACRPPRRRQPFLQSSGRTIDDHAAANSSCGNLAAMEPALHGRGEPGRPRPWRRWRAQEAPLTPVQGADSGDNLDVD